MSLNTIIIPALQAELTPEQASCLIFVLVRINKGNICLIGQFLTLRNWSVAKQLAMEITRWPQSKENKLCAFFCISFKIRQILLKILFQRLPKDKT